jgi:predicted transcriptional regulator
MFFILLYKYLESLKWVLLIVGFLFFYRKEIKGILNRPFSVTRNGTRVDFLIQQQKEENSINNDLPSLASNQIEKITKDLENKESVIKDKDQQIFKLTLEKHFEYTYRLIFRSQIQLLQNLQILSDGFTVIQLNDYFENIKKNFVALSGWDSDLYLKFLYDQNLIIRDNVTGKIKITPIGDLFLKYLIISGYNFNTEKGF